MKKKIAAFENVVLATDASGAMDFQEVKHINIGINQ